MLAGAAAYVAVLTYVLQLPYEISGAVLIGHVLALVVGPMLVLHIRRAEGPMTARLIGLAFYAKMAGALARFAVVNVVYGGTADATRYHEAGAELARQLSSRSFEGGRGSLIGTRFIELVTGYLYSVVGTSMLGGFLVFSSLGFFGLYFMYRAVRIAVPSADPKRYAMLIFFVPSLVFWPSSIGKEAWMMLAIGLTMYGAARLFNHLAGGLTCMALGLLGSALVRPHITLALVCSLLVAALYARRSSATSARGLARVLRIGVLIAALGLAVGAVEQFFKVESLGAAEVGDVLDRTEEQSAQGGSRFAAPSLRNPLGVPVAVVTVLFRPFPFEASNFQSAVTSAEGMTLLVLFIRGRRRVWAGLQAARENEFLRFALVYSGVFIIAFSNFSNFGLLARERVQVFPFVLLFLALPTAVPEPRPTALR